MHHSERQRRFDRRRCAIAASVCVLATACVKDGKKNQDAAPATDVAAWDFPAETTDGTTLFPPDVGAPTRMKRHLGTHVDDNRLFTVVEGQDPQFFWQLEMPVTAFAVHTEFEADEAGTLQVFWSTRRCPVYSEACSATTSFGAGRTIVEWMLDPTDPLRALRIDPPDHAGARLTFDRVVVRRTAVHDGPWTPNGSATNVAMTPLGLDVEALEIDPWLVVPTPGLEAKTVSAVELIVRVPPGETPKLYWQPEKGSFSEQCSVVFSPADSGALTHRGVLKYHPCWTGRIEMLRLDPGQMPGHYVVEGLALVRYPD